MTVDRSVTSATGSSRGVGRTWPNKAGTTASLSAVCEFIDRFRSSLTVVCISANCTDNSQTCGYNERQFCKQQGAYLGNRNTTKGGQLCANWHSAGSNYGHFGAHNQCRSSEGHAAWCYYLKHASNLEWDYCFEDCRKLI